VYIGLPATIAGDAIWMQPIARAAFRLRAPLISRPFIFAKEFSNTFGLEKQPNQRSK
jgi:hypothetical protein